MSDLRHQIVAGELSPGGQLPTRKELEQRYQVSRDTVQRALDLLAEEKFVFAEGRRGTFVSKHPPHLSHYALVFQTVPDKSPTAWSRFEQALYGSALEIPSTPERRISMYHGVSPTTAGPDFHRLQQDILNHRLAGVIFAFDPAFLQNTIILQDARIARVSTIAYPTVVPAVTVNMSSFMDRALDFLVSRGRRRIAAISHQQSDHHDNVYLASGIVTRGLTTKRYWLQTTTVGTAASADQCAHLLMNPDQRERPDALIVDNDNLVEHAVRGLLAAGARVPEDVEVVSHANFPLRDRELPVPVTRLGFDMRQILDACFASLKAQQEGRSVAPYLTIGALFEGEVPGQSH